MIEKGSTYQFGYIKVMVVDLDDQAGEKVFVREVKPQEPGGLGPRFRAIAKLLKPLPMKYFGGQTP